jgi:hypothetical protein
MARSAQYIIHKVENQTVFLIDPDNGQISITNNAEQVCREINKLYPKHRIIYRDTMGQWDELVHNNGIFIDFKLFQDLN